MNAREITLGVAVLGARAGATAGRIVVLPVRIAARTPIIGRAVRRTGEGLAAEGRDAVAEGRRQAEAAAGELVVAPEIGRTVDLALAGPLPDAAARSLAEHHVVERVAVEVLATADFEQAVAAALENERVDATVEAVVASPALERVVTDLLESKLTVQLIDRVLRSPELQSTVGRIAASPEVRAALGSQARSLADETADVIRRRTDSLDDSSEHVVRRVVRRPRDEAAPVPYAGLMARAAAGAIDLGIAGLFALATAGLLALVTSLIDLKPEWLVGTLIGIGWQLVVGFYLVLFWTTIGQTPGMRLMGLRVADARGEPPGFGRSLLRLLGLILAIIPMFAGFLPVLIDDRRRALQDFMASTTVRKTEDGRAPANTPTAMPADLPLPAIVDAPPPA